MALNKLEEEILNGECYADMLSIIHHCLEYSPNDHRSEAANALFVMCRLMRAHEIELQKILGDLMKAELEGGV